MSHGRRAPLGRAGAFALIAAVALIATIGAAGAQVTEPVLQAPRPSDRDPFCAVSVTATSTTPLVAQLRAAGASVSARVVVFSRSDAYVVDTPALPLSGTGPVRATTNFAIVLNKSIEPRYIYVDSYRLDGGAETECQAEPVAFTGGPFTAPSTPAARPTLQFSVSDVEALPPLTCGVERTQATIKKAVAPGGFDTAFPHVSVQVLVYVDAHGRVARGYLYKPSWSNPDNAFSIEAASKSAYMPATFYCKPVAGSTLFVTNFDDPNRP
jgi:hypothetical protein